MDITTLKKIKEVELDVVYNGDEGIITDSVRQYRADCKAGQFKIGASRIMGKALNMEIIGARVVEDELFGYKQQEWIVVLFVDSESVVSSILFKTESMDNLLELRMQHALRGESILGRVITARMSARYSKKHSGDYYAVEFETAGEGKHGKQIAEFRDYADLYPKLKQDKGLIKQ